LVDEGKGFTDAANIVAVGGLVLYPLQTRHNQKYPTITIDGGQI
jgi:hypothetical protein